MAKTQRDLLPWVRISTEQIGDVHNLFSLILKTLLDRIKNFSIIKAPMKGVLFDDYTKPLH